MKQAKIEGETKAFNYRLPLELRNRVAKQARLEDRSMNLLVIDALEMYLREKEVEPEKDEHPES